MRSLKPTLITLVSGLTLASCTNNETLPRSTGEQQTIPATIERSRTQINLPEKIYNFRDRIDINQKITVAGERILPVDRFPYIAECSNKKDFKINPSTDKLEYNGTVDKKIFIREKVSLEGLPKDPSDQFVVLNDPLAQGAERSWLKIKAYYVQAEDSSGNTLLYLIRRCDNGPIQTEDGSWKFPTDCLIYKERDLIENN